MVVTISADNFVGVWPSYDSLGRESSWYVAEGMMPNIESEESTRRWKERCQNKATKVSYPTRGAALEAAHDMVKEIEKDYNCPIVEYGVLEP